jgi:hypothetical protein
MLIKFERIEYTKNSTVSKLSVDNKEIGWGLEDVVRSAKSKKIWGQTAIPAGRYQCVITWSPKFKRNMPLLLGVPGYEGVRIHWGNDETATEGCLLVGKSYDMKHPDWIAESRAMFNGLYPLIEKALSKHQLVWVEVLDTKAPVA